MASNYPEGSMFGSGIYAEDYSGVFNCPTCEKDFELDGETDDWKSYAYAECPECGDELRVSIEQEDYDTDLGYDAWREENLD